MENIENSFFGTPQNKIDEYKMRIKNGESIESFGEIPESWKKELQSTQVEAIQNLEKAEGFFEIKNVIENKSNDNYILTHITSPNAAQNIFESNFRYSLGTGLSGTMTFTGGFGAIMQIEKILNGESPHRGLEGMFVIAIPKIIVGEYLEGRKVNCDSIEDFLIENYPEMSSGNIPKEFNFGYLNKDVFYYKN